MKPYSLVGRNAVVTGASSGIGLEIARHLAENGVHLLLGAHPAERSALEEVAVEMQHTHRIKAWAFVCDLGSTDGPRSLFHEAGRRFPQIDILVNNAGIMAYGRFDEIPLERMDTLFQINARAYLVLMRLVLPGMIRRGEGRILNVSSLAAFQPTPLHAAYGAAKAMVQSLSEAVAEEVRSTGVVVSTLNPPYTATPMICGGAFPARIPWIRIWGLCDPASIGRAAVDVIKTGKSVHIPRLLPRILHTVLPRLLPRSIGCRIGSLMLRP
ncbi:MAG: SDR family NAD(P)-dependent oxidoreductase [Thermodesulfobacteriota bacterium]